MTVVQSQGGEDDVPPTIPSEAAKNANIPTHVSYAKRVFNHKADGPAYGG
jgi:hypothetical protein